MSKGSEAVSRLRFVSRRPLYAPHRKVPCAARDRVVQGFAPRRDVPVERLTPKTARPPTPAELSKTLRAVSTNAKTAGREDLFVPWHGHFDNPFDLGALPFAF